MSQAVSATTTDTDTRSNSAFAGLACNVRDNVRENAGQIVKAARGALVQAGHNGNAFFQELVSTGQAVRTGAGGKSARTANAGGFDWQAWLASTLGLPTRKDIDSLNRKLDRISRKVNKLAREQQA